MHFWGRGERLEVFPLFRVIRAISARRKVATDFAQPSREPAAWIAFTIEHTVASYAIFSPRTGIRFLQVATSLGPVDVELSTQFVDGWGSVQHAIVASVTGFAPSGADVSDALGSLLEDLLSILSLSANAWVGWLKTAADNDYEKNPSVVEARLCDAAAAVELRELHEVATGALLDGIAAHPCAKELWKVARSYRQALAHWTAEQQSIALARLHEGFLTMSDVLIRFLCEARGLTRGELANEYKVRAEGLSSHVLQTELYQDDVVCFHATEAACRRVNSDSQQVTEGDDFAPDDVHITAARYLRSSVIRVAELEARYRSILLTSPYDVPLAASRQTEHQHAQWEVGSRDRTLARTPQDHLERGQI
jgi:hypothetical protein